MFDVAYAWAAKDREGGLTTSQWCDKFAAQAMPTQEALIAASDCIVVLSPDNPEQHESLAHLALQSGKPVYVDKTFATSFAAAERMFSLAEQNQTPLYSTSALRYAQEFSWFAENGVTPEQVSFVSARGPASQKLRQQTRAPPWPWSKPVGKPCPNEAVGSMSLAIRRQESAWQTSGAGIPLNMQYSCPLSNSGLYVAMMAMLRP